MKTYRVIWDKKAKESLKAIVLFIKEESPTAARKVRLEILKLTAGLNNMPDRFSVEPYLEHTNMSIDLLLNGAIKSFIECLKMRCELSKLFTPVGTLQSWKIFIKKIFTYFM